MRNPVNLLEDWYEEAKIISSPLNIQVQIPRKIVEEIYYTLKNFFPSKFFAVKKNFDSPIGKVSWLHSLLSNRTHIESIGALNEIASLINYSKTLENSIQRELTHLINNPQNLRSFLFELFIYQILDKNKIPNKKKIQVGNQIIEGTFSNLNTEYLFECRKLYLPKIAELDILRRLMVDFRKFQEMKIGIGIICTISFKRPVVGEHRSHFKKIIHDYFTNLNKKPSPHNISFHIESQLGEFNAIEYSEINFVETTSLKKYDILFYLKPPEVILPNQKNLFTGKIISNFSFYQSDIYKKLEASFKEKKRQHRNSKIQNKVIFLDSEHLNEFQMGLFQSENMFNLDRIKELYEKTHMEDTVCIFRRKYSQLIPQHEIAFFYRESEMELIELFKKIFS